MLTDCSFSTLHLNKSCMALVYFGMPFLISHPQLMNAPVPLMITIQPKRYGGMKLGVWLFRGAGPGAGVVMRGSYQ